MKKVEFRDKLNAVFDKTALTPEEFGRDGFRLLRILANDETYVLALNRVQTYLGTLDGRLLVLLQHMFDKASAAPFIQYTKKGEKEKYLNEKSTELLKKLFLVDRQRLEEYIPNMWINDEEVAEIWGLQTRKKKEKQEAE